MSVCLSVTGRSSIETAEHSNFSENQLTAVTFNTVWCPCNGLVRGVSVTRNSTLTLHYITLQCVKSTAKFGGLATIWEPANFWGLATISGPVPPGPSAEPPLSRFRPFRRFPTTQVACCGRVCRVWLSHTRRLGSAETATRSV